MNVVLNADESHVVLTLVSAVGAALAHSSAREARANAIMRQPQVVGYSPKAHVSDEATMGWLKPSCQTSCVR